MPEGFEDSFVRLAQKAPASSEEDPETDCHNVEMRERQAATLQAEEVRKTATEQLIHAEKSSKGSALPEGQLMAVERL